MTDLELRLIHCEKEPSEVALYDAADAYLAIGDEEMFHGLKYMADKRRMPWKQERYGTYHWASEPFRNSYAIGKPVYSDILPAGFIVNQDRFVTSSLYSTKDTFADAVRWLGKRLIELGMVSS